ncbi:Voltage-dependent T-type calcium channel subunit alpha-1G [Trachymyrmex zeteki]|uniref:Voltage-dependent T-type calcium channel subunit alpha-1G n=1 Tax=Mycetomoellerius zeteki TaxID=64791 RepID=A0A151WZA3_9HYME|nr:Voltage-dependent T-type calcium channel subunit alpha-1G [Trachymyrmex zeteki]
MSLHYPQGYRYRSASKAISGTGVGEQGSDSDVAELSDLEDDEDEDGTRESADKRMVEGEDEDEDDENGENDVDDEDDDDDDDDDEDDDDEDEEEEGEGLPYPGFIPIALRYLDQTTRPRNWCLALITNPYPFGTSRLGMVNSAL